MVKELVKDLAKYTPSFLVPALVGFLSIPIITRLFPPEVYGNYVLITTTVSLMSTVSVAWLSSSAIRFLPAYARYNRLGEFKSTIVKLLIWSILSVSTIFLFIIFFLRNYILPDIYSFIFIGCLLFIASSAWTLVMNLLRANRKSAWYSGLTIWHSIGGIGIGLILVFVFGFGIEGLLWGMFISILIAFPLLYKQGIGKITFKEGNITSPIAKDILKFGLPILAVNLSAWALTMSDRYIIQMFRDGSEVGIYSASMNISGQGILMIGSLFLLAEGPLAYNIWEKQGEDATRLFINKLTRYYILLAIPVVVGLSVLAKPVVSVFCVPEYLSGYKIVPFVVSGALFSGIAARFNVGLTCKKRTDLMMYCSMGAGVLNIGLNFLLVPLYGYIGAALSFFISYAVNLIAKIIISRFIYIWPFPFKSLCRISLASLVMAIAVYFVTTGLFTKPVFQLISGICSGMVVYILMLFLLKEFQQDELSFIGKLLQKSVIFRN